MTTIQSVIDANVALESAFQDYAAVVALSKPTVGFGMSVAMEDASSDGAGEAKKNIFQRFMAFLKRMFDYLAGIFGRTKEKTEKVKQEFESNKGASHADLVAKYQAFQPGFKYGQTHIREAVRGVLIKKALHHINDDPAAILVLRNGGFQKAIEEHYRTLSDFEEVMRNFDDALNSLKGGNRYRKPGIAVVGFGANFNGNGGEKIDEAELPSLLNKYDRKAATREIQRFLKDQPRRDKLQASMDEFVKDAEACIERLKSSTAETVVEDLNRLRSDVAEIIPHMSRNVMTGFNIINSATLSAIEVNKEMRKGGEFRGVPTEAWAELAAAVSKMAEQQKVDIKDYVNGVLNLVALDNCKDFEMIEG